MSKLDNPNDEEVNMNDRILAFPRPRSPMPAARQRGGFTMVELITVIGIIALLATFTVVGLRSVGGNAKKKETSTRLERLRNAMGEMTLTPQARTRIQQVVIPTVFQNFKFDANNPPRPPNENQHAWDAVPAASENTLYKTGEILRLFSANAAFKKILDDMPATAKKTIVFTNSGPNAADRWRVVENPGPKPWTPANRYVEFTYPLDSWGNPILFVFDNWEVPGPGGIGVRRTTSNGRDTGGLTDLYSESAQTFWQFQQAAQRPAITDKIGYAYDADMMSRSSYGEPDGVPVGDAFRNDADRSSFWFSAGEDGKYQTHDDNLYSFEGN